jgi:glutamate dehydrogenase (NAD(P)+)
MKHLRINPRESLAALQGFGNVAQYAAIGFREILGGKVACVSCYDATEKRSYTFSHPEGVDARFLQTITDQYGTIDQAKAKAAGYLLEDGSAWIAKEVDVLIPAAIEEQLTAETSPQIDKRVKIIAEGANGPTTMEADEIIRQRGIFLIPDFLCNGGGVTTSYFESVQNDMNFHWSREEVLERVDQKMSSAFQAVLEMSLERKVSMRDAAYLVAVDRVVKAMQMRGWV